MNLGSYIKIPPGRYEEASEFIKKLHDNDTNYVKVNYEYYEILFASSD